MVMMKRGQMENVTTTRPSTRRVQVFLQEGSTMDSIIKQTGLMINWLVWWQPTYGGAMKSYR